ncbi:hypothetical protein [Azohydromonas aeria]|uniref:hypothetical protein n=1 Tax=Azohydromonas aeria TaxID=2590212 RepID=UPI0012F7DFFB|nr:hypothetical protein [Azohydromonas aeria]
MADTQAAAGVADAGKWLCPACGSPFHAHGCAVCDMGKKIEHLQRQVQPYRNLVAALQAQRDELQRSAAAAMEAVKTLESERAANARLTDELEQAQREAERERNDAQRAREQLQHVADMARAATPDAAQAARLAACWRWSDAAAAVADLQRERDEARAALKPFADAFEEPFAYSYRNASPEFAAHLDRNTITPSMTMGAFRRAREVMDGAAAQEALR